MNKKSPKESIYRFTLIEKIIYIVARYIFIIKSFSRGITTTRQFVLTKDILNGSNQIALYLYREKEGSYHMRNPPRYIKWDALEQPVRALLNDLLFHFYNTFDFILLTLLLLLFVI